MQVHVSHSLFTSHFSSLICTAYGLLLQVIGTSTCNRATTRWRRAATPRTTSMVLANSRRTTPLSHALRFIQSTLLPLLRFTGINATREAHEAARAVAAGTAADEPRGVDRVPEVTRHAGQPTGGLNFRPETSKKLGIEIETIPCPTQECYVMTP